MIFYAIWSINKPPMFNLNSSYSVRRYLKPVFLLFFLGFATPHYATTGLFPIEDGPQLQFARAQIKQAQAKWQVELPPIHFQLDTEKLGDEAYEVKVSRQFITIHGGDANGLMYGGLAIAEQIDMYQKVSALNGQPFLRQRGIKFNIPLDARTPSYDDSGDAAQKNIAEMWNWGFWEEFLDDMALHRYNVLSLWNPHPFPSMIRLPDYPDVALDDVCVTTLQPVGRENEWGDPQLVTSNVVENLKVVKKIGIDEKIDFWQKVMAHAKDRGIEIYFITWNICPNSVAQPVEPFHKTFGIKIWEEKAGKHGITHQMDNPKTIAYYRAAVKTFLLTYPNVKGIGVTAGEYMPQSWKGYNREQWLWETYGLGIQDAKALQPDRVVPFIHRVWYSDMDQIMKYWKQYPDPFEVSFKYAKARLYSSPEPPFAASHVKDMEPYGLLSWWNLRNDDIFVYRWGDPDYVRRFLRFFPKEKTAGYYMGSDGYVWGREFISKQADLQGELEIKKHWFSFLLWGRLGYNDELDASFFIKKLGTHYGLADATQLYESWQTASKIIPLVNEFHWRDWDHMWSVEACMARPVLGGFRSVLDFIDNPTMPGSGILNPVSFAKKGVTRVAKGSRTPVLVAESLQAYAHTTLTQLETLRNATSPASDYLALLDDMEAMAYLGQYYAKKIEAATALAFYDQNKEDRYKKEAITHLEQAYEYWKSYAKISKKNYHPQMLARTNLLDWSALTLEVIEDINAAKRR